MTKARDLANLISAGNPLDDGAIAYSEVTGTPTIPVAGTDFVAQTGGAFTGDVSFGDNDKAIFGAGSDLQVYHDGSNSYITDTATGSLHIKGTSLFLEDADGNEFIRMSDQGSGGVVYLKNLGATKLATTSTGVDVTGTVVADGGDITGELIADSYNETYSALSGTTPTVNCETGNSFSLTLSGNTTFTFSNPPASGTAYSFSIEIIQDAGASGYTVTWPTSVDWPAATAPTLTATASAVDVFMFTTRDGGTTWYGFTAGQALA